MTRLNIKDLLLAPRLDRQQVAGLLSPYGFKDPPKADANLQAVADDPSERELLADILEDLLVCVSQSADPDQALNYFERFARAALNKTRLFSYLKDSPRMLEILARTLGGSPYMAEILIRDPHHFYWLTDPQVIYSGRKKREIQRELARTLKVLVDEQQQLDYLRVLKRREMLHIGVRDLLRLCSVEETLAALSILAEALISATYWICSSALRREYGIPRNAFTGFTILAMGKLGGGELNFSSDVDLMYLYATDQEEAGSISAPEYFRRLCQKITGGLNEFTGEGYVYRVDLRLRPEGKAGNIADSLDGYRRYYQSRMGTWERLALLKTWPVAGDRALGGQAREPSAQHGGDAARHADPRPGRDGGEPAAGIRRVLRADQCRQRLERGVAGGQGERLVSGHPVAGRGPRQRRGEARSAVLGGRGGASGRGAGGQHVLERSLVPDHPAGQDRRPIERHEPGPARTGGDRHHRRPRARPPGGLGVEAGQTEKHHRGRAVE